VRFDARAARFSQHRHKRSVESTEGMRQVLAIVLAILLANVLAQSARAADTPPADANKMCPVMTDTPAKSSRVVEFQGQKIYFCCQDCIAKFKRNPQKYLPNLAGFAAPAGSVTSSSATTTTPRGKWFELAGKLHIVVVHFPIALIILAGLLELLRFRKPRPGDVTYFCLIVGAAAAVVAAVLGWIDAGNLFGGVSGKTLFLHRWLGITLAAGAVLMVVVATVARARPSPFISRTARAGMVFCALLVAVVGHFGGTLSYGEDYYTSIFKPVARQAAVASAVAPTTEPSSQAPTALQQADKAASDPMQIFLFGTSDEAKAQRIRMRLAAQPPPPAPPQVKAPVNNEIDRFIVAKWNADAVQPAASEVCDDATFCRRVYLDLIGVVPTVEECKRFTDDKSADKRAKLIDELLARDADYSANFTPFFEEAIASGPAQASIGTRGDYQSWIIESFRQNRPWDVMFAQLVDPTAPGFVKKPLLMINGKPTQSQYVKNDNHVDTLQTASNVGQFFLGTGMKCASCHSHFLNDEWPQQRFLGFAGLFSQKDLELIRCEKPSAQYIAAHYAFEVPGAPSVIPQSLDQRLHYVTLLTTDPANPRFARTAVNRLWKRYLGLGLFEPADDFRIDSPAANPQLLDWLAYDFALHGYDLKHTIRLILNSRTYQLKYDPKLEDHFDVARRNEMRYWRSPSLRKLTAEQIIDSIRLVTTQKLDDKSRVYHSIKSTALTRMLGRPASRNEISTARPDDVAIVQSLELLNGSEWANLIYKSSMLDRLSAEKDATDVVDFVYRAALSRPATKEEIALASEFLKTSAPTTAPASAPSPEDVVWLDDDFPPGARVGGAAAEKSWHWSGHPDPVFSGFRSHVSVAPADGGATQHLVIGASPALELRLDQDMLYTYIWIDPANPPKEIMIQFNVGDWEHRAYWGKNIIGFGADDSPARRNRGALPAPGQWARLEVPAHDVGLSAGSRVVGIAFDQVGGKVFWDKTGVTQKPIPDAPGLGDLLWATFTSPEFQYIR
jgi:uncharacterized membrane protein/YHS domain-containing protein